ncbi:MAG: hypothetical protein KAU20_02245 [Nanoarchaeota archaeon]|nr:hypothetical protein [Nanoarchaeota archaeon]
MTIEIGDPFNISKFGIKIPFRAGLIATFGYIDWEAVDPIYIPDYMDRVRGLLIEQLEKKKRVNDYLQTNIDIWQEIEKVAHDVYILRGISNAGGYTLDIIGEIVGLERKGLDDDEYRAAIYFQIFINLSNGEPETLIAALQFSTNAELIRYLEIYPAEVFIHTDGDIIPVDTAASMQLIAPAAVKVHVAYTGDHEERPFCTGDDDGFPHPAEGGHWEELGYFGADPDYKKGQLVELITNRLPV